MSNKTQLQTNNAKLDALTSLAASMTEKAAALPEAGSGGGGFPTSPDDGKTRIYIHLEPGRTSPVLGVCPWGTVTVDWGDNTTPDILTGSSVSTAKWTPAHNYSEPGDYVITLTLDGTSMGFVSNSSSNGGCGLLRYSSSNDARNQVYINSILRVEIGDSVLNIQDKAFYKCQGLSSVVIPNSVKTIGENVFYQCYSLVDIDIPSSVTSIGSNAFYQCYSLADIDIPSSVTTIESGAFYYCYRLASITIPDGVTSINSNTFRECRSIVNFVISPSVTSIDTYAFSSCTGASLYDFSRHTVVPALEATNVFSSIPADCKILVPASLYDDWIAATNWSTYASYIQAAG